MYQRILVPVDGSSASNMGLDEAIKLARLVGGELRLVHVVDQLTFVTGYEPYGLYAGDTMALMREAGQKILADANARAQTEGIKVESLLFDNLASRLPDTIVEEALAWGADLIVIGTHGRRGIKRLVLGSGAEQILRVAPVPVLLVRSPDA